MCESRIWLKACKFNLDGPLNFRFYLARCTKLQCKYQVKIPPQRIWLKAVWKFNFQEPKLRGNNSVKTRKEPSKFKFQLMSAFNLCSYLVRWGSWRRAAENCDWFVPRWVRRPCKKKVSHIMNGFPSCRNKKFPQFKFLRLVTFYYISLRLLFSYLSRKKSSINHDERKSCLSLLIDGGNLRIWSTSVCSWLKRDSAWTCKTADILTPAKFDKVLYIWNCDFSSWDTFIGLTCLNARSNSQKSGWI